MGRGPDGLWTRGPDLDLFHLDLYLAASHRGSLQGLLEVVKPSSFIIFLNTARWFSLELRWLVGRVISNDPRSFSLSVYVWGTRDYTSCSRLLDVLSWAWHPLYSEGDDNIDLYTS